MSRSTGIARRVVAAAARAVLPRRLLFAAYDWALSRRQPWLAFDRELGIDTRGFLPAPAIFSGSPLGAHATAYLGVMPSVLRRATALLPAIEATHFLDIGAGKGRALAIASERPFRSITGIELSPDLCAIARRNARIVARRFPKRRAIRVIEGDASRPQLPANGDIAALLYHPFGAELVAALAGRLAEAAHDRRVFLIYVNPVHGEVIDAHPTFKRWYAEQAIYDDAERAVINEKSDALVIWQAGDDLLAPHEDAARAIRVIEPGWRSELAAPG